MLAELEAKQKAGLNPEPFLLRKSGQSFYNTSPLDMKKLMGDQDHIRENLYAYIQAFSPAVRDIFERFDFAHPDRAPRQGRAALPGHREVRPGRPASRGGGQPPDGPRLRGADPQVRGNLQRDRRRALHAARGHPPDGQPDLHRGRRRPGQARRGPHHLRPDGGHRRHAVGGRRVPRRAQPAGAADDVRPGTQPRVATRSARPTC